MFAISNKRIKKILAVSLMSLALLLAGAGGAGAQTELPAKAPEVGAAPNFLNYSPSRSVEIIDPNLKQASCTSCGLSPTAGGDWSAVGCPSAGCGTCCYPGRIHCCSICEGGGGFKSLCCGLYHCICCPDPCYEPRWIATANAAFFSDSPRPVSHMRLRYDGMFGIDHPDRAEYFIKRFNGTTIGSSADINEFRIYTEIAPTPGFGFFIDLGWRDIDFDPAGLGTTLPEGDSGFGDLILGTKSVLLDCELLLATFQFTTYIPTGNPNTGLSTGHVSLEPALLGALKLSPDFYLQFQTALWIPIGGTSGFAGPVWHNHLSFNKILYRFLPDVQLIGTLEFINYNVMSGGYTDNIVVGGNAVRAPAEDCFFNAGPGLRLNICDRIDFGAAAHFSLTGDDFIGEAVRAEFRWRY